MRSALYIGSKQNNPTIKTKILSCGSPNGMPFCFDYAGTVTQWQLVREGEEYGYDLDVSWLTNESGKISYNGDIDLLAYLDGLGYNVGAGRWYYSFRLDGVEEDVYKLEGTDAGGNYLDFDSTQAYGVFDFDIDYVAGGGIDADIIRDGIDYYYIRLASTVIQFKYKSTTLFEIPNTFITTTGRVKLTVKRNETLNQYFTGAINAFAFFINDVLIDDATATTGSNPLVDGNLTTSTERKYYCSQGISLYDYPDVYTVTFGAFTLVYIYSIATGGTIQESNIFRMECEDLRPVTPGDFTDDWSNDWYI